MIFRLESKQRSRDILRNFSGNIPNGDYMSDGRQVRRKSKAMRLSSTADIPQFPESSTALPIFPAIQCAHHALLCRKAQDTAIDAVDVGTDSAIETTTKLIVQSQSYDSTCSESSIPKRYSSAYSPPQGTTRRQVSGYFDMVPSSWCRVATKRT